MSGTRILVRISREDPQAEGFTALVERVCPQAERELASAVSREDLFTVSVRSDDPDADCAAIELETRRVLWDAWSRS